MAVDDEGVETLKKSAEEVVPGSKADYYHKVGLFDRETNSAPAISPSGAIETAELIRLIGGNFEGALLPAVTWLTSEVNGGTVCVDDGELLLATNTTADGEGVVQSVNRAEFITATFNKAHLAFGFGDFTATDVICEFGMYDPVSNILSGDGVFYRNDSGTITLVRRRGGVEVEEVDEADFNGSNTFVKNNEIHVYELTYNAGRIDFLQDRKIIHRMTSLDAVAFNTTHLTLGALIQNINGNTAANTLRTRGFACSRIGTSTAQPDSITLSTPQSILLKNSPGELKSIVITDSGAGVAELQLFDDVAEVGTPIYTINLTEGLISLPFNRRLNFGLFAVVTGNNFEVGINWR